MTTRIIIIVVILLVITIIASLFLLQSPPSTKTPPGVVKPTVITPTKQASTFYVTSIYPQIDQANNISIIASVKINFNEPFNKDSFVYKVNPDIATNVNIASSSATITPKISWPMGQEITIIISAESNTGVSLSTPYIIKILSPIPKGE